MFGIFIIVWSIISSIIKNKVEFVNGSGGKELLYKFLTFPSFVADFAVDKFPANFSQKLTDWFAR